MSGPSLETTGPVKAGAVGGSRSRRKLLTTEEGELFELAQAAGTSIDPEVFKILLDLLRMNVAPAAIFQMLRSMCAGQRLAAEGAPELARGRSLEWVFAFLDVSPTPDAWHVPSLSF
uniref:Uncharacterized protein n=1 Tax=Sphaerodactylus townsendi TaxID=933632 RepID=A0ACB8F2B2_9SAUR